jgi:hypothetical protein
MPREKIRLKKLRYCHQVGGFGLGKGGPFRPGEEFCGDVITFAFERSMNE